MAILNFLKKKKTKKEPSVAPDVAKPVRLSAQAGAGGAKTDKEVMADKENKKANAKAAKDSSPDVSKEASKEKKPAVNKEVKEISKKATPSGKGVYSHILLQPRITEKATELAEQNIYTFDVDRRATKPEVKKAIQEIYNVTPVKIRMTPIPSKLIVVRGRRGKMGLKSGGKKAMVYLREGETIEFI